MGNQEAAKLFAAGMNGFYDYVLDEDWDAVGKAAKCFARAAQLEPDNARYHYYHAEAIDAYLEDNEKQIIAVLSRALECNRGEGGEGGLDDSLVFDALADRGLCYQNIGNRSAARADYTAALELFDRAGLEDDPDGWGRSRAEVEEFLSEVKDAPLPAKAPVNTPAPKAAAPARFCSECGAKLEAGAAFCAECGEKTEQ